MTVYITTYFFAFTRFSLWTEFTGDDLMNLYFAWIQPYRTILGDVVLFFRSSPTYRPLGAFAYKVSFALFDFNLLPLRIFCLGVLAANVFLVYAVARRLTRSREIGALAALIHSYHFSFAALYCNTGTIYDILCFFFYFTAFLYYLRVRRENAHLSPLQLLFFSLLYILALDSKEMAVTLPVLLVFYEALYNRPPSVEVRVLGLWLLREARAAWIGGVITAVFILGRVMAAEGISRIPDYTTSVTLSQYCRQVGYFLNDAFYARGWFNFPKTLGFLLLLLAGALILRSAHLAFSGVLFVFGVLPVAFIPPRALFAAYVPTVGLAVYAALLLVKIRESSARWIGRLSRWRPGTGPGATGLVNWSQVLLFVALACFLWRVHPSGRRAHEIFQPEYAKIREVREQLSRLLPDIRPGGRILFLEDPFESDRWLTTFIIRLLYRDNTITIERMDFMDPKPDAASIAGYDFVLTWKEGRLAKGNSLQGLSE